MLKLNGMAEKMLKDGTMLPPGTMLVRTCATWTADFVINEIRHVNPGTKIVTYELITIENGFPVITPVDGPEWTVTALPGVLEAA